ncbi:hypothetical protein A3D62_00960 [Candidatus Kaiserbacteria bacterium RIFCSPHIGHO2_02_FULL_49_11]|uniref:Methyltransferase n=1 Tax=Candidatus Kaiserbacteria bacterium RIFCSPHIGHO2_02_FULL_49_11 TaxID=1798489 RepID=A0A1F6D1T0_9BACT|nr:MAG: hypothetical protein A3D62_00960 [Candidatus Kaiserbacteria bacterium RIFCSPHIGHO2_02_FULL_49_11]
MRRHINRYLLWYFKKFDPAFLSRVHPYYDSVSHGECFDELHERGLRVTGTPKSLFRRDRFFNLYSALELVKDLEGEIVECGVWKGLSSHLICNRLKEFSPSFDGSGYHVIDSFEGLSAPTERDQLPQERKGRFAVGVEETKHALNEFPNISYHKGWIPDVFSTLPEQPYRFVHIDVDLADPAEASFEYFYPRLIQGGVIVCDDYGSISWPGTKGAVDEFCKRQNINALRLSTGQILILK